MKYRRFGRTELSMPVFSCGGMRYQYKWQDVAPSDVPEDGQANLEATIHRALELGINHIETARGYGSSEMQLGRVLPTIARDRLIVQTKVGPSPSAQEFRANFETSMAYLHLDHVDLLAFHGVNNSDLLDMVIRPGGCLEVVRQLQREGRVRHVGFSTHGPCSAIISAINTSEFDYINLHWYFVNPLNWPAIEAARAQDMGVFLISPTDKGGMLQSPSAKMVSLCEPLAPMQFNDLYCLKHPEVHTLSVGASRPSDFDAHVEVLAFYDTMAQTLQPIEARIRVEMERCLGAAWVAGWWKGLPEHMEVPGDINLLEILRIWTYASSLDLIKWGQSRYNLLGSGDHWQPGRKAGMVDLVALASALHNSPFADRIPALLQEAEALLGGEAQKRQSES